MKPRSFTPLWRMPRSSRRSTVCANVACEIAKVRWWTAPGSVGVRVGSGTRSSFVKTVMSRPSPGSKYRWLSFGLSRLGCSKTNGIPSTPSQKSIEVCRPAPTIVMWWTPWLCSFRKRTPQLVLDELRLVLAALQRLPRHEVHAGLDDEDAAQSLPDRLGERGIGPRARRELDVDRQRRLLLDPRLPWAHEDVPAHVGGEGADHLAHGGGEKVDAADDQHVVRPADAADARPRAAARARRGAHHHLVAGAEAQQRRGPVAQMGQHELARGTVLHRDRGARPGVDQL